MGPTQHENRGICVSHVGRCGAEEGAERGLGEGSGRRWRPGWDLGWMGDRTGAMKRTGFAIGTRGACQ